MKVKVCRMKMTKKEDGVFSLLRVISIPGEESIQ